jgi:hypothetical protein
MFNSAVLDLAIGLIFCFLTVSLATGAIVEAIASLFAIRASTLRKGIGQLVNDSSFSGLAKEIYAHAVVNPRGDGTDASISAWNRKNPAYIDRQLFGQAMLDILKISPEIATAQGGKPTEEALKAAVDGALKDAATAQGKAAPDDQLQKLLYGIIERSLGDPDDIKKELVAWFDNAMDRVSGWYKRWTQLIAFIVALALAVILNVEAVNVAKTLWVQPKLAGELIKGLPVGGTANTSPAAPMAPAATPSGGAVGVPAPNKSEDSKGKKEESKGKKEEGPEAMLHRLDTTLPIGWPHGFFCDYKDTSDGKGTSAGKDTSDGKNTSDGGKSHSTTDGLVRGVFCDDKGTLLSWGALGIASLGWLITALSTLFGAPFWFDLLQTVIRLKGAGPSPVEKVDGKGASA